MDGNHKLIQPYRIVIHGAIDGFSRLIVFLRASTNNRASTVLANFQEAVNQYSLPSRVRTDMGLENIEVARFMLQARGVNRGSITTGTSVHNQRIERLWREVNSIVCSRFVNIFSQLEALVMDTTNEMHLFALHLVYIPLVNEALDELRLSWNSHSLSTESNFTPEQLWIQGMVNSRGSGYSAVNSVQSGTHVNWSDYGMDEDGPVPELQSNYNVQVPESPISITEEDVATLNAVVQIAKESGDSDGLVGFLIVLNALQQMFN